MTILSLKSSAKAAPDPYTITAQSDSVRMRPRMPLGRSASGLGAGPSEGREHDDDNEAAGPSKLHKAEEGRSTGEVMWEVGSVSDDDDDDDVAKGEEGEGERRGIGGGNVRGERRGLLIDEPEDGDAEVDTPLGRGEKDSGARGDLPQKGNPDSGSSVEIPSEAERNPFAEDDGFGEFEGRQEQHR